MRFYMALLEILILTYSYSILQKEPQLRSSVLVANAPQPKIP